MSGGAMVLGCVADDFTGATDLANNLVRAGMRVVQTIGVPDAPVEGVDAVVVALKSRTAPVEEAVAQSVAAGRWLREHGAQQLYFKVCSTFDSTPRGNIGPVTEALMALTGATFVPVTPAFPEAGRTVFKGHLFVGDLLLSDSSMRHHPLTPMTDASLVRVMQAQCASQQVGLIDHATVSRGPQAIAEKAQTLQQQGVRIGVVDSINNDALHALAQACSRWPLVVALKSRTAPVEEAVAQSVAAGRWLREQGAQQLYFKVCSTFDSTPRGNIGPVTEALMALTGASFVPVTPAFPEAGRTVFKGHLFVGDLLLSDSSMRNHPLTPMTDASLVRVMQAQCASQQVGLIDHATVSRGSQAIAEKAQTLQQQGVRIGVVDSINNDALHALAQACSRWPLVVAGSGLAIGLPSQWGLSPRAEASALPAAAGHAAIVSGSCSAASQAQVADFVAAGGQAFAVDPLRLAQGDDVAAEALAWATPNLGAQPVLVYATAPAESVKQVQAQLGVERAGLLVEETLARVAQGLVARGVGRLVVAGGETSGACVQALGVTRLRIGGQIDPGVPWCHAGLPSGGALHLALKSGNFGGIDFFRRAFTVLGSAAS